MIKFIAIFLITNFIISAVNTLWLGNNTTFSIVAGMLNGFFIAQYYFNSKKKDNNDKSE